MRSLLMSAQCRHFVHKWYLALVRFTASMTVSVFLAVLEIWNREQCVDIVTALLSSRLGRFVNTHDFDIGKKAFRID